MKYSQLSPAPKLTVRAAQWSEWISCAQKMPPHDVTVETKIVDAHGNRNQEQLRRHGNLWFFPDMSMYVYYSPTHWRPLK